MSTVLLRARCPRCTPDRAYTRLADFAAYPSVTDTVLAVEVSRDTQGRQVSSWEVRFREGVLCWSEFDEFDECARRITFVQRDGDPASFQGSWHVEPSDQGCDVSFAASFDLGMPSFAAVVDPLAARTLLENMTTVILALVDPDASISSEHRESAGQL